MVREIDDIVQEVKAYIAKDIFPGAAFAILEGMTDVQRVVLGNAQLFPKREKLYTGMLWDLASVSKVVGVGTVVINRLLSGDLELDTPLQYYYSDWYENTVTLRQLLTHTSGINPYIKHRESLNCDELIKAINHLPISVEHDEFLLSKEHKLSGKSFRYTDINFILLGLMLEAIDGQSLDKILQAEVFKKWQLMHTSFGPICADNAVPTAVNIPRGIVHDPKARVLGIHCGSAGLFSDLSDMIAFVIGYFADAKYLKLLKNYTRQDRKSRSLAWDLLPDDWLLHTGYTGTFILMNLRRKQGVIFLSNRLHLKDERVQWIIDRNKLIATFIKRLST